jgi:hypothetical protein
MRVLVTGGSGYLGQFLVRGRASPAWVMRRGAMHPLCRCQARAGDVTSEQRARATAGARAGGRGARGCVHVLLPRPVAAGRHGAPRGLGHGRGAGCLPGRRGPAGRGGAHRGAVAAGRVRARPGRRARRQRPHDTSRRACDRVARSAVRAPLHGPSLRRQPRFLARGGRGRLHGRERVRRKQARRRGRRALPLASARHPALQHHPRPAAAHARIAPALPAVAGRRAGGRVSSGAGGDV